MSTNQTKAMPNTKPDPGRWYIYWRLLRPFTLTASIIPVLVGTSLAVREEVFHFFLFVAMLVASIAIQAATNMFNEYYDFKRGLDTDKSVGIGGAIVHYGVPARTVLLWAILLFALSVLLGLYIVMLSTWWIALIGSLCMVVGYLYTGGPYPIAYSPFGEIFAGFFMGSVIVMIAFYIHSGSLTAEGWILSVPISILVAALLTANNIRDLDEDRNSGRKTLVILLGKNKAIIFLSCLFILAYVWTLAMIIWAYFSWWLLITLFSMPKAMKVVRLFQRHHTPAQMAPAVKTTAQLHTLYGVLSCLAILISSFI